MARCAACGEENPDRARFCLACDGYVDAAEALALLGDREPAIAYARDALRLAEAKGNLARAAQLEALVAGLQATSGAASAQ